MNNKKMLGIAVLILVACFLTVAIVSYNVGYTIGRVNTDNINYKSVEGLYRTGTGALVLYEDGTFRGTVGYGDGTWTQNGDEIKLAAGYEITGYIVGDGVGLILANSFWEKVQ